MTFSVAFVCLQKFVFDPKLLLLPRCLIQNDIYTCFFFRMYTIVATQQSSQSSKPSSSKDATNDTSFFTVFLLSDLSEPEKFANISHTTHVIAWIREYWQLFRRFKQRWILLRSSDSYFVINSNEVDQDCFTSELSHLSFCFNSWSRVTSISVKRLSMLRDNDVLFAKSF